MLPIPCKWQCVGCSGHVQPIPVVYDAKRGGDLLTKLGLKVQMPEKAPPICHLHPSAPQLAEHWNCHCAGVNIKVNSIPLHANLPVVPDYTQIFIQFSNESDRYVSVNHKILDLKEFYKNSKIVEDFSQKSLSEAISSENLIDTASDTSPIKTNPIINTNNNSSGVNATDLIRPSSTIRQIEPYAKRTLPIQPSGFNVVPPTTPRVVPPTIPRVVPPATAGILSLMPIRSSSTVAPSMTSVPPTTRAKSTIRFQSSTIPTKSPESILHGMDFGSSVQDKSVDNNDDIVGYISTSDNGSDIDSSYSPVKKTRKTTASEPKRTVRTAKAPKIMEALETPKGKPRGRPRGSKTINKSVTKGRKGKEASAPPSAKQGAKRKLEGNSEEIEVSIKKEQVDDVLSIPPSTDHDESGPDEINESAALNCVKNKLKIIEKDKRTSSVIRKYAREPVEDVYNKQAYNPFSDDGGLVISDNDHMDNSVENYGGDMIFDK